MSSPKSLHRLELPSLRQGVIQKRLQASAELCGGQAPDVPGVQGEETVEVEDGGARAEGGTDPTRA